MARNYAGSWEYGDKQNISSLFPHGAYTIDNKKSSIMCNNYKM